MNITDLITKDLVILDLKATEKDDVIKEIATLLEKQGKISDLSGFVNDVKAREMQTTTGIGDGVAIPHAKSSYVIDAPAIIFARSINGVDYKSLDNAPAHIFFMLAVPQNAKSEHVEILGKLSALLLDENFKKDLLNATSEEDIITTINRYNNPNPSSTEIQTNKKTPTKYFIVAVTACPVGIAHTYMAAEALTKAAKSLNIEIKVETNGANGVENELTPDEIKRAHGVILAINKNVETNRFAGKQVIKVAAAEGIKNAKDLLLSIIRNKGTIHQATKGEEGSSATNVAQSKTADVYKHLMSGVSYMLPFVVSGGILIALAFLFDRLAGITAGSGLGSTTETAKLFMDIGKQAFGLFVPILGGFIAFSIGNRAALTAGLVGGAFANAGGSGFLGAIIAGFIAGYITLFLMKMFKAFPKSIDGIKNILILPVSSVLITGILMILLVNSPVKFINEGLVNWLNNIGEGNAIVLGVILGTMMAIDMGGPINKAAYVFGAASLAAGESMAMAAVMAGGMTPALGIALSTTFFRNKFTKDEREAGKSNYIMGLSFITEGAIPFAAANPIRVIPALALGSAIAGGLSMLFKVALPAPHGGLIVMFLANHVLLYMLAVAVGSVVTAIALAMLRKTIK